MVTLVFDIESNGLLDTITKIHCICIKNLETNITTAYTDNSPDYPKLEEGIKLLAEADCIIGHNIINFDIPAIQKLYPFHPKGLIRDTLTCSRLIWTDLFERDCGRGRKANNDYAMPKKLYGSHSLEAWGYRLHEYKGAFCHETDWANWSLDMQNYCCQDVEVTSRLWKLIESKNYSKRAINLEHQFQIVIRQQEVNGIPFDKTLAEKVYAELCGKRESLTNTLSDIFPPKDKGKWFVPKRDNKTKGYVAGQKVWKADVQAFNPLSRQEIAERFREKYDWKPKDFTPAGTPIIDDEVLQDLPFPEAKQLAELFLIQKRIGQLAEGKEAWLKLVKPDGRIHGEVITNGAVTGRCTHKHPNIAQCPACGVPYGEEFRSMFYAPEGYVMVGCDAAALELRCLAHYMALYDQGEYAHEILNGDIHWTNTQALGLVPKGTVRDKNNPDHEHKRNKIAKKFVYAFLYGAGGYKIGTIAPPADAERARYENDSRRAETKRRLQERELDADDETITLTLKGNDLKSKFLKALPALKKLIDGVQEKAKDRKYLIGIDGRILHVRSAHSALNTLLQSAGAIAVKKATCLFWEYLTAEGLADKVQQVAHVHDEFQCIVKEGYEQRVGELAVKSFQDAGKYFNFRCHLDGEYKSGRNWAETH